MENSEKASGVDRRKYIRYACKARFKAIIDCDLKGGPGAKAKILPIVFHRGETGMVRDISEKGISLEVDHFLPAGMTLKITIENPVTPPIQTGARIMWARKIAKADNKSVMGLAFRYMRERHRRNLLKLIEFLKSIPQ